MTGRGRPDIGVAQCVRDCAIPAGALAEHAATSRTTAAIALFDRRQHLLQQKVFPRAGYRRVDVLVAPEPREAVGEGDHDRRNFLFVYQPIEPLGQVLTEADPIRMR
jgi:hypothetical protein